MPLPRRAFQRRRKSRAGAAPAARKAVPGWRESECFPIVAAYTGVKNI
ncbi:MAG: hypothetical protein JWR07_499 [Nevskia sp.]|nr:hypothetical protein [Nevskia sp.]